MAPMQPGGLCQTSCRLSITRPGCLNNEWRCLDFLPYPPTSDSSLPISAALQTPCWGATLPCWGIDPGGCPLPEPLPHRGVPCKKTQQNDILSRWHSHGQYAHATLYWHLKTCAFLRQEACVSVSGSDTYTPGRVGPLMVTRPRKGQVCVHCKHTPPD